MLPLHHNPKAAEIRTQTIRFQDEVTIFYATILVLPTGLEPVFIAHQAIFLTIWKTGVKF